MEINKDFWNNRYLTNETGWDLKAPSTPLKEYINQTSDKNLRILIPGCGNAYEAEYLLEKGFTNITLIDISDILVKELKEKFKNNSEIKIINHDFFKLEKTYDLILEQTFFCALDKSLRKEYVKKMYDLLSTNGKLVGLLFNKDFGNPFPPFGGEKSEYESLFKPYFEILKLEECYNSIKPRLGSELFFQLTPKK